MCGGGKRNMNVSDWHYVNLRPASSPCVTPHPGNLKHIQYTTHDCEEYATPDSRTDLRRCSRQKRPGEEEGGES